MGSTSRALRLISASAGPYTNDILPIFFFIETSPILSILFNLLPHLRDKYMRFIICYAIKESNFVMYIKKYINKLKK